MTQRFGTNALGKGLRQNSDLARSIVWSDCDATLALAQKTRRAVRDEVISTQERRVRARRNLGFAICSFVGLFVLLAPAIWNGLEDLLAGEHLFDLPTLVACLILMLFSTMLAVLIAVWREQRDTVRDRGGIETFRHIEK
jgi:hypothetical protein